MSRKYWPLALIGALFFGAFFWSVWFETLLPLIRNEDAAGLRNHLIGLPIIFAGTGAIVYGGFRALREMFDLVHNPDFVRNAQIIRARPSTAAVRAAQRAHLRMWARSLGRGLLWMLAGFGGIAGGGYLINL